MRKKNYPLNIIYEDDSILVCNKPAGLSVQTAKSGETDLVSQLKTYRIRKGEPPYIGVVHRLDQPVRGIMVFAKNEASAAVLSKQVRDHLTQKEYFAVICAPETHAASNCEHSENDTANAAASCLDSKKASYGSSAPEQPQSPLPQNGELHDYLLRDGRTNTSRVVPKGTPNAKEARLSYEIVRVCPDTGRALVRIRLHTGRHHQIRVQFAHAGFPLYADTKYGQPLPEGKYCPIALCSYQIGFSHPKTKKQMTFSLPDAELNAFLQQIIML